MSNLRKAFEKGKAFIPFITCGDPDLETTERLVREAVKNGADLIELGIPFSDPTAEAPSFRARMLGLWLPERRRIRFLILCGNSEKS